MRISIPRRRRAQIIRLTPLVDIIFLLLLFFMLSSNFLRFTEIPVAAGIGDAPGGQPRLVVRIEDGSRVAVNGLRGPISDIKAMIDRIDPPFGTTAAVVGRTGSVQDLVAVSEALRAANLGILLVHR